MSRLMKRYHEEVKGALQSKFAYSSPMKIPELKKIVVSMGVAEAIKDKGVMQDAIRELTLITGQKPIVTKAKKSIANFKLREEQAKRGGNYLCTKNFHAAVLQMLSSKQRCSLSI